MENVNLRAAATGRMDRLGPPRLPAAAPGTSAPMSRRSVSTPAPAAPGGGGVMRALAKESEIALRMDNCKSPPFGTNGGHAGRAAG